MVRRAALWSAGFWLGLACWLAAPLPVAAQLLPDDDPEVQLGPFLPPAPAGLSPFVLPWDDATPAVTSLNSIFRPEPAGKSGWMRSRTDGRLEYGGKRLKLWGAHFVGGAALPGHEEAVKLAARLAKLGVNLVRLSGLDGAAAPEGLWSAWNSDRKLNLDQLDRLDFFVSELKKQGIWTQLVLYSSRPFFHAADLPAASAEVTEPEARALLTRLDPAFLDLEQAFVRGLLNRTNPYTGLPLLNDPALAFVEVGTGSDLSSFFQRGGLDRQGPWFLQALAQPWNAWLRAKYKNQAGLAKVWKDGKNSGFVAGEDLDAGTVAAFTQTLFKTRTAQARSDWLNFLLENDLATWNARRDFLRKTLGFKGLVTGCNLEQSSPQAQAGMDAWSLAPAWSQPVWPKGQAEPANWYVVNDTAIAHPESSLGESLARARVTGKPLFLLPTMTPAGNTFEAEALLLLSYFATALDYDAVIPYRFAGPQRVLDLRRIPGFWDLDQNPLKLVGQVPAALAFRRGDFPLLAPPPAPELPTSVGKPAGAAQPPAKASSKTPAKKPAKPPVKPEPPFTWEAATPEKAWFKAGSSTQAWLIGFVAGQKFAFGGLTLLPGDSLQKGWSAQTVSALDGRPLEQSRSLLWTVMGTQDNSPPLSGSPAWRLYPNTPVAFPPPRGAKITHADQWGRPPSLIEGVKSGLLLPVKKARVTVWALDPRGQRKQVVPTAKAPGNQTLITVGPDYGTVWYEIRVTPP